MGSGILTNPPAEGTPLTPAADVPPESFVSTADLTAGITGIGEALSGDALIQGSLQVLKVGGELALLIYLFTHIKEVVALYKKYVAPTLGEIGGAIVEGATDLLTPVADLFGQLSAVYVKEISRHYSMEKGAGTVSTGTPAGNAAQYAFDSIVAPIAFFSSGSDPTQDGAGARNIQQTLGVIVQIHLVTWVVNVISNLTGIGTLHFINSFNEVILAALNARALSRLAMRPYVNTMITEPATAELNTKWPLKSPAASSDIKSYLRGAVANDTLIASMKRLGYSPEVTAQLLLDNAHLMTISDVAYVVRTNQWTNEQGVKYLQQLGYEESAAIVVLHREVNAVVFENNKRAADQMGAHFAAKEIDEDVYREFLRLMGFTDLENQSYRTVYGVDREFTRPLTYTQVKDLFNQGLVDLDFVRQYLTDQRNKDSDIDLLILLDFTAKDQLDARKAALGATARVQAEKEKAAAATAQAKGEAAIAAALAAQSAAKANLAAKYDK